MTGGYRQGNRDEEARAWTRLGAQGHVSLEAVHGLINHRESHAPTGEAIDGGGGGKPRPKDDLRQLFRGVRPRLGLGKHTRHLLQVYATAIVFHLDNQPPSL